ncbi:unnamed protein product [Oppiella nova]|uniref:Uncharacterized protein n=1 Tax=Oppiella nova TaxID=334625 RepID=A0A7R9M1X5_9ACAR|nr:unnamed protein product [Oppiella nova]CAG2168481.1 unnamed protein product [Oppiella nova]
MMEFDEQGKQLPAVNENSIRYQIRRKWNSLTIRKKRRLFIKIILFVCCLSALTYHAILLFSQYFSGKTVVSIRLDRIRPDTMPAITLCLPYGLRMDGMARRFPPLKAKYSEYKRLMDSINDYDYKNETLKDYLIDIFKNFTRFYDKQNMSLDYMFDSDVSIPYDLWKDSEKLVTPGDKVDDFLIKLELIGVRNNMVMQHVDMHPVVSVVAERPSHIRKCFTFFSELNPAWRNIKFNLNEVTLIFRHNKYWFPPNMYETPSGKNKIHFSIHSANATPYDLRSENFINLKMDHTYQVAFSTIKTIRLKPPYETNCHDYDPDNIFERERTRSDCRYKCFEMELVGRKDCCIDTNKNRQTCRKCTLWSTNFIQHHFAQRSHMCPYGLRDDCALVADDMCEELCQKSCHTCYYNVDIKDKNRIQGRDPWDKVLYIELAHNPLLDQTVEHSPEMSFISFIANMGGLIGMWLGLSAFIILETVMKLALAHRYGFQKPTSDFLSFISFIANMGTDRLVLLIKNY